MQLRRPSSDRSDYRYLKTGRDCFLLLPRSLNLTQADRVDSNSGASVAAAERDAVCPADPPSK